MFGEGLDSFKEPIGVGEGRAGEGRRRGYMARGWKEE